MVVVHLPGQDEQVFPLVEAGELSQRVAMLLPDQGLKQVAGLLVGEEVDAASQVGPHAAEVLHPLLEAGLVLGLGRHGHDDAPQGVDGYQETGHHHLAMKALQQVLGQHTEEGVHDVHLPMETDDDVRDAVLLGRVDDARGDVQVVASAPRPPGR